jgi:hypothetical protein
VDPRQEPPGRVEDLGHGVAEVGGVAWPDGIGVETAPGQEAGEVGELPADERQGIAAEGRLELPATRLPPGESGMVVGPVEAAGRGVDGLEQVGAPHRLVDRDRLGGVHRPAQLPPAEKPDLETHTVLGALLPRLLDGIEEVEVGDHHADLVEPERVQHAAPPSDRTVPGRTAPTRT